MRVELQRRADPGIGDEESPIGTVPWAQRIRLSLQSSLHRIEKTPKHFSETWLFAFEHRAWTLMNKPDGTYFASAQEFVEHPEPWGLGADWETIQRHLAYAMGEKAAQLATVAPAVVPVPPMMGKPNSGGHPKADPESIPVIPSGSKQAESSDITEKRLRAIATRAPEPVRELYKADLLGQKEAARLGPKNPTPDQAALVTEVAQALTAKARELPKSTAQEKAATKRELNQVARALLGEPTTSLITTAKAAIARWSKAATDDEWRQLMKLFDDADMARAESATSTTKETK